ncbi:hypothetical protein [Halomarina oriensis]|uniref:Uncharacterized protein n=1 Tax=Halomarina oriensis TaxID=671145 RepID=A0A6B0GRB6_9EURY|nr:hypothetical protein [Halomarina oriensis]MWG35223.1 hypothetical protein [Halomarina oriensis]
MVRPEVTSAVDALGVVNVLLHGGTVDGEPHVLVLTVAVVGLLAVVAGLVVGLDRLLAPVAGQQSREYDPTSE